MRQPAAAAGIGGLPLLWRASLRQMLRRPGQVTLAIVGVVLMGVMRTAVAYTLPISAGVTLYVAASDLIPEVNREPEPKLAFLVFFGLALLFLLHKLFHI